MKGRVTPVGEAPVVEVAGSLQAGLVDIRMDRRLHRPVDIALTAPPWVAGFITMALIWHYYSTTLIGL